MDGKYHDIQIVMRFHFENKTIVMRRIDASNEAEILRVINMFNSAIQEMTGVAPVQKIVID